MYPQFQNAVGTLRYQQVFSEYLDFWGCAFHMSNSKFTLNLFEKQTKILKLLVHNNKE